MARESFKPSPADRTKIQVIGTDDLPDLVSVDLDDKDPNHFTVVEVDDRTDDEKVGTTKDPAEWDGKNANDPKGVTPRVQKRFDRLKAETETERRIRLQAERDRDEAIRAAQALKAETDDLRQRLAANTTTTAKAMTDEREVRIEDAKRRLEQAHAEGNSKDMAAATADMTRANAELVTIQANTPRPQAQQPQQERQVQQPQRQAPQLHPDTVAWIAANPRFNRDVEFTQTAMAVDRVLEAKGIRPGSPDYLSEVDRRMKAEYPDHQPFSGSRQDGGDDEERTTAPRRTNAVAPGSRENGTSQGADPRKVELTSSQLAIAKQLNLSPQQYALSLSKYNANRKGA